MSVAKQPAAPLPIGISSHPLLARRSCCRVQVVSFGVALQLVEVTWKAKLKTAYPDPADYSAFMGKFSETTGGRVGCSGLAHKGACWWC